MSLVEDFFNNFMRVRLNRPMRANLDFPFAEQSVEAIITPRIDSLNGPVFDFYDVDDPNLPIFPPNGDLHQVIVRTRDGHRIETILNSWGPVAMGLTSRNTEGSLVVSQREFPLSESKIAHATFCIEDFPRFLGPGAMAYVEMHPKMQAIGSVEILTDGWEITLTESTTNDLDFNISHTGLIRKEDESVYSVGDLKHLISGLTYFFSFVTGAYRMPAVVMARSAAHKRVWGQYGNLHQAQYVADNWFSRFHGNALTEMFPGFWECFKSDEEQVRTVIGLYCESSMIAHSGLHKNALVTSRSALQGVSKWQLNKPSVTSKEIKRALNECGISFDNVKLRRITDVRDEIDHADFRQVDYQESHNLWKLSQSYVEKMLFKRFDYQPPPIGNDEIGR